MGQEQEETKRKVISLEGGMGGFGMVSAWFRVGAVPPNFQRHPALTLPTFPLLRNTTSDSKGCGEEKMQ